MMYRELADRIEQYFFERGEYDFRDDDKIQWLRLENDDKGFRTKDEERYIVTLNIMAELNNGDDGIMRLYRHFDGEANNLDNYDDLIVTASELAHELFSMTSYYKIYADRMAEAEDEYGDKFIVAFELINKLNGKSNAITRFFDYGTNEWWFIKKTYEFGELQYWRIADTKFTNKMILDVLKNIMVQYCGLSQLATDYITY